MKLNHKILGSGQPIIVLHGLLGMLDNWQGPARLLEDSFTMVLVDLRNHGHSSHSSEHNYEVMAADVLELMDELNLHSAHILGHSMGGKVAMKLAQENPQHVQKLMIADIGPKFYSVHHRDILSALRAVPLDTIKKRTDAEEYMKHHVKDSSIRQFLMKSLYHPDRHSFGWRFNLDAIENQLERVGEAMDAMHFEGETLFLRGERSNYILDEDWPEIKVLFPNAYLVTIENAGHWLHAEQPVAFIAAVRSFLLQD